MSLRQYVEFRTDEQDGSQVLADNHRKVADEQLVPRIIKRNEEAILVDPHYFWFFQRKHQGRRCSCFKVESSPDGLCQVCYGTAVVGGYEKFGTTSEVFDVTYPFIRAVNVRQAFELQTRPVLFTLDEGAMKGYVEFDWEIRASRRKLDVFQVVARDVGKGAIVEPYVKGALSEEFVPMNRQTLTEMMCGNRATIRIVLRRKTPDAPHPVLSHFYVRYLLIDDPRVRMDVPRTPNSITLAEYGVFDSFQTQTGWMTSEVKKVSTEDFFRQLHDNTYWKAIETNPNQPLLQTTSHDITLRLVQDFEVYKRFPQ